MSKITELKPAELSAVHGGVEYAALARYLVHIGVVGWQHWIEMKRILLSRGSGSEGAYTTYNERPSAMQIAMKALTAVKDFALCWKSSHKSFGWFAEGRRLDDQHPKYE